ncbi:cell division protein FtsQ/DivIB [Pseudodesulfovibrio sediminis]|uniref:Cell division protein FtsQ n=1 Tax=Pseudodesulfovibrio sediminis TaxID=2810563 RepID=A0ABN6ESB2_9BACT|nr:FtsQ-type POTRA domain-containing protein [Pseudodesulfovibrio sediminis]BCS88357.1 cell division protein FtsQ [Pseudodesulfovibrio sediminis]
MSTLTMDKQSRLSLGNKKKKRANSFKRTKKTTLSSYKRKSPRSLTGIGQIIVRTIMTLLLLSFVAALSVGMLYGYRYITSNPYFNLTEIHVSGNTRLSYSDVLSNADVALGLNSIDMNVGEVESRLSTNPWIQSVTVRRELPNRLRIGIVEKVPAFWIRQGDGLYFADANGKVIAPMHPGEIASLPVLSVADNLNDSQQVLTGILQKMAKKQTPFTQNQAAWIKLTSAHELEIYLDGHAGGQGLTVKLSMDRWEVQLERLKVVWRDLMRRNEFDKASIIAASGDKIWIKRRPVPAKG